MSGKFAIIEVMGELKDSMGLFKAFGRGYGAIPKGYGTIPKGLWHIYENYEGI